MDDQYIIWPNGVVVAREDFDDEFAHMSDDYLVGTLKEGVALGYITEEERLEYEEA